MQKITTFLWFDDKAEESTRFYVSLFKNSKFENISYYGEGAPRPKGPVLTVVFQIDGQQFMALNGGPHYSFTPAISLLVNCETQEEVDRLWNKLLEGGKPSRCGWLQDRYGLSWQIVPTILGKLMSDPDCKKADRVMQAMLKMDKLDIKGLEQAYEGYSK